MKSKILVLGASSFAGSSFISLSIKTGVFKKIVGVYNTYVPITFSTQLNAIDLTVEPSDPSKTDLMCFSLIILLLMDLTFSRTNKP